MSSAAQSIQRQYNGFVRDMGNKEAQKLNTQRKKLVMLEEEMENVRNNNWPKIEEKKVKQLGIIEERFKEFRKSGIMKKEIKFSRRTKNVIHPKVAKHHKWQKRISDDLLNVQQKNYDLFAQLLFKRIERCRNKIKVFENNQRTIDFQLDTLPILSTLVSKSSHSNTAETTPWCLEATTPEVLALPSSSPPFHLLDQPQRFYLNTTSGSEIVSSKPTAATGSTSSTTFNFKIKKPAAVSNLNLLKTDNAELQGRHLRNLLPAPSKLFCPECKRITEWSKDEKEATSVCASCATVRSIATSCKESTYGMEIDFTEPFHYEKRGHFIDCLKQRQSKQETDIPASVLDRVRAEILRRQMLDPLLIRPKHIRKILKHEGLSSYYDDDVMIWARVTGNRPPRFTETQEAALIRMFDLSLSSYLKHKGVRNNYLTYSFAIHKMLEVLDWPEEIREFYPVLKSDSKREAQEAIWFNMCIDMDWPRIQTLQKYVDEAKFSF